ncbi:MAG: hypothetical protein CMH98_18670 [Oceanospirillaceae bacterium]|nr:hypothetical protein [Oceanospirillaceae bacterium]
MLAELCLELVRNMLLWREKTEYLVINVLLLFCNQLIIKEKILVLPNIHTGKQRVFLQGQFQPVKPWLICAGKDVNWP